MSSLSDPLLQVDRNDFLSPMQQQFDRFFEFFFSPPTVSSIKNSMKSLTNFPKVNVYEDNGELIFKAALVGVDPKDLNVEVVQGTSLANPSQLVISGSSAENNLMPNSAFVHIRELRGGKFERRFALPKDLHGDPETSLKDGILTIKWKIPPPKTISPVSKKIPILNG